MPAAQRAAIDRSRLQIRLLAEADADRIGGFTCGVADLDEFLRDDARRLQEQHVARTYLALYAGELAG
jgi:hypothetical protein